MKNLFIAARDRNQQTIASKQPGSFKLFYLAFLIATLFTACKKQDTSASEETLPADNKEQITSANHHHRGNAVMESDEAFCSNNRSVSKKTLWELLQARAATAKYRNIENAVKDGYADLGVIVPNMGYHYMKSSLKDGKFEVRRPEILVYNKNEDGTLELVAVEYAVPIDLTPNQAPSGFTGTADVWDRNTGFGLWLLHAWVWHYNPAGVFNPTNPLIHVH